MRKFYRKDEYGDRGLISSHFYYQSQPPCDHDFLPSGRTLRTFVELPRDEWIEQYFAKHHGGPFDAQLFFNLLTHPFVPKSYEHLADHLIVDDTDYG